MQDGDDNVKEEEPAALSQLAQSSTLEQEVRSWLVMIALISCFIL